MSSDPLAVDSPRAESPMLTLDQLQAYSGLSDALSPEKNRLQDHVILVTGAGKDGWGIGTAIAGAAAARGAQVVIAEVNETNGLKALEILGNAGLKNVALRTADLTNSGEVRDLIANITQQYGQLDGVVNNVGAIRNAGFLHQITDEDYHFTMNTTALTSFLVSQAAIRSYLPRFKADPDEAMKRGFPIVQIGSVASVDVVQRMTPYNMAKAAVLNLTKSLAIEYSSVGARPNIILPGTVATNWVKGRIEGSGDPAAMEVVMQRRQGFDRLVDPTEIALAAAHLLSPASTGMAGSTIEIDGGWLAGYIHAEAEVARKTFWAGVELI